jgi:hypothetical protein
VGRPDPDRQFPLFALRVRWVGSSLALLIPKNLRDQLQIHHGDIVAIRVHAPYATFCVWPMNKLVPLGEVPVDTLPPREPVQDRRGR